MTYTYNVKTGDVAKFPNGVEVNYDPVTNSLVVLHPNEVARLTVRHENSNPDDRVLLAPGVNLIGVE